MNQRFLAVCLAAFAAATLVTVARTVARDHGDRAAAVLTVVLALGAAAVLANAAVDLW